MATESPAEKVDEASSQGGKKKKTRDSAYRKQRQEARRLAREAGEGKPEDGACRETKKSRSERKLAGGQASEDKQSVGKQVKELNRGEERAGAESAAEDDKKKKANRERENDEERNERRQGEGETAEVKDAEQRSGRKRKRRRRRKHRSEEDVQEDDEEGENDEGDEQEEEKNEEDRGAEEGERQAKAKAKKRKAQTDTEEKSRAREEAETGDNEREEAVEQTFTSKTSGNPESASSSSSSSASSSSSSAEVGEGETTRPEFTKRYCVVAQQREGDEERERERSADILRSLHPCVLETLRRRNIHSLFPVQRTVVNFLTRCIDRPYDPQNCDLCVSAPTGEGKTFCYVLPIVSFLLASVARTTRCVVLVPTRELAVQVAEEFRRFRHVHSSPFVSSSSEAVCRTRALTPDSDEANEEEGETAPRECRGKRRHSREAVGGEASCRSRSAENHTIEQVAFCREISVACLVGELSVHRSKRGKTAGLAHISTGRGSLFASPTAPSILSAFLGSPRRSEVSACCGDTAATSTAPPDVVVCTPGKFTELVWKATRRRRAAFADAVRGEGGVTLEDDDASADDEMSVTLEDVRWLVIDEADRLVRQPYHDWMKAVAVLQHLRLESCRASEPSFARSSGEASPLVSAFASPFVASSSLPLQKLTFSATMTKNPKSLALLNLTRPLFVLSSPSGHYAMPQSLAQRYVVCDSEDKPLCLLLLLLHLLRHLRGEESGARVEKRRAKQSCLAEAETTADEEDEDAEEAEEDKTEEDEEKEDTDESEDEPEDVEPDRKEKREETNGEAGQDGGTGKTKKAKVLIFCSSRDATHRLARLLQLYFERPASSRVCPSGLSRFPVFSATATLPTARGSPESVGCDEPARLRGDAFREEGGGEEEGTRRESAGDTQEGEALCSLRVREMSSSLSQRDRVKLINSFKNGVVEVLVCSDLAARGLDVEGVDAVFHYDAPQHVQAYVHRSGRSARAGAWGVTVTLVCPQQMRTFREMIKRKNPHLWKSLQELRLDLCRSDSAFQHAYAELLRLLSICLAEEAKGKLDAHRPLPPHLLSSQPFS
ncbi:UNVERIFIED_CONTAM: DEAD/DEAH box helicase domain-containing protein [Hammondia hammondi]|eukprot:XP_008885308.1 DEAD/DEAH box helicase domain-containing protein [Hammondia hammondi]